MVGHRNPDTDSICAAIAYANLKCRITGLSYEARRAGNLNEETQFVLKKFGVKAPKFLGDVRTQVRDMEIRRLEGASEEMSLKKAWEKMKDAGVVTLCITKGKELEGLITTGDIVTTYMDVYDSDILDQKNHNDTEIFRHSECRFYHNDLLTNVIPGSIPHRSEIYPLDY